MSRGREFSSLNDRTREPLNADSELYNQRDIFKQNLLGDHSVADPPDPMPNSDVKRSSADGSVGSPHVRVGHRQAPLLKSPSGDGLFLRSPPAGVSGVNTEFFAFRPGLTGVKKDENFVLT